MKIYLRPFYICTVNIKLQFLKKHKNKGMTNKAVCFLGEKGALHSELFFSLEWLSDRGQFEKQFLKKEKKKGNKNRLLNNNLI